MANENTKNVPIPDPSTLTAVALQSIKEQLTEWVNIKFENVDKELNQRDALTEEKFKGVYQQFAGRDTALEAALRAQKASVDDQNRANAEAAAKSETAFTKQIDGLAALMSQQTKATDDKIAALDKRITEDSGHGRGVSDSWAWLLAAFGIILSIATVIIAFIALSHKG